MLEACGTGGCFLLIQLLGSLQVLPLQRGSKTIAQLPDVDVVVCQYRLEVFDAHRAKLDPHVSFGRIDNNAVPRFRL